MGFHTGGENELARQFGSILLVFALLAAAVWRFSRRRRAGPGRSLLRALWQRSLQTVPHPAPTLHLVDRLILTPTHVLHTVRVQGREIVLMTHPQGCTSVASVLSSEAAKGAKA